MGDAARASGAGRLRRRAGRSIDREDDMAKYGKQAQSKVEKAMHERKAGSLRSGKSGNKVKSRKQAIAIGLSEARREGAKVPAKKSSTRSSRKSAATTTQRATKATKKGAAGKSAKRASKRSTKRSTKGAERTSAKRATRKAA
jgi:hypothetical protein